METTRNTTALSVKQLTELLQKHNIPWRQWGYGTSKTLDHLIDEIQKGESLIEEDDQGKLIRRVGVAYIDILHKTPEGNYLKLTEEKQIFKDGRQRSRALDGSIAEKLQSDENASETTALRAIREELGIKGLISVTYKGSKEVIEDSPSYPGLLMQATNYYFEAYLNHEQYKPEGYIEKQADKDTYFVWENIETGQSSDR